MEIEKLEGKKSWASPRYLKNSSQIILHRTELKPQLEIFLNTDKQVDSDLKSFLEHDTVNGWQNIWVDKMDRIYYSSGDQSIKVYDTEFKLLREFKGFPNHWNMMYPVLGTDHFINTTNDYYKCYFKVFKNTKIIHYTYLEQQKSGENFNELAADKCGLFYKEKGTGYNFLKYYDLIRKRQFKFSLSTVFNDPSAKQAVSMMITQSRKRIFLCVQEKSGNKVMMINANRWNLYDTIAASKKDFIDCRYDQQLNSGLMKQSFDESLVYIGLKEKVLILDGSDNTQFERKFEFSLPKNNQAIEVIANDCKNEFLVWTRNDLAVFKVHEI